MDTKYRFGKIWVDYSHIKQRPEASSQKVPEGLELVTDPELLAEGWKFKTISKSKDPLNDEIFNHPPEERLPTEICMESSLSTCLSHTPIEDEYDRTYGEIIIHGINERENTNEAPE